MALNYTVNHKDQVVEIHLDDTVICRKIEVDESGHQFFSVPNLLSNPTRSIINQLFNNRIKDIVETIRNGNGDVYVVSKPFNFDKVLYYLDREYGESIRQTFLEGWKNTEFAYGILWGKFILLDVNDNFDEKKPIHYFETEQDAQNYLNKLLDVAKQDARHFNSLDEAQGKKFWNSLTSVRQTLLLFELHRNEAADNSKCPLRVHQTVRRFNSL